MSKLKIVNDVCFFRGKERTTHVQKLPFSLSQMILIIISQDNFPSFHLKKRQVQSFLKAYKVKGKKIAQKNLPKKWNSFRYGSGYDLAARRKNATRESTATLKAWLNEHKKNPYPTKGEKIMLAIITKMTLTQVSFLACFRTTRASGILTCSFQVFRASYKRSTLKVAWTGHRLQFSITFIVVNSSCLNRLSKINVRVFLG